MDKLTSADAGAIAGRARKLLRAGEITHHQLALIDALLWTCRRAGIATARVSYSQLQVAAHLARSTIAAGLKALERLGLIQRTRHRVVATGANGGRVWRQLSNVYRLVVNPREFVARADSKTQDSFKVLELVSYDEVRAAQEALRRIAAARAAKRAAAWLAAKCAAHS